MTVQYGLGKRGYTNPNTGELASGPETLSEEELMRNRTDLAAAIQDHPLDDRYHRDRSPVWSKITVPFLSSANWGGQGLHPRGNFEGFTQAASTQKWLEAHGLEHWTEFYTRYGVTLQKRFFDHFLKGNENDWKDQPPVQLQVRRVNGFVQRSEKEWPLARARWTRFYFNPADRSLGLTPASGEGSIEYERSGKALPFRAPRLRKKRRSPGP